MRFKPDHIIAIVRSSGFGFEAEIKAALDGVFHGIKQTVVNRFDHLYTEPDCISALQDITSNRARVLTIAEVQASPDNKLNCFECISTVRAGIHQKQGKRKSTFKAALVADLDHAWRYGNQPPTDPLRILQELANRCNSPIIFTNQESAQRNIASVLYSI